MTLLGKYPNVFGLNNYFGYFKSIKPTLLVLWISLVRIMMLFPQS